MEFEASTGALVHTEEFFVAKSCNVGFDGRVVPAPPDCLGRDYPPLKPLEQALIAHRLGRSQGDQRGADPLADHDAGLFVRLQATVCEP